MRRNLIIAAVFLSCFSLSRGYTQEENAEARFSHKGLKAAIGSASFDMIKERGLEEGEGGTLNIGYGFSNRFSIWFTLLGSEHLSRTTSNLQMDFGGLELNLQHKFEIRSRLQPYGKVGVGIYALQETGSEMALVGAGLNIAFGVDFFFSKHFGVGAELMYKKLDYYSERLETVDGTLYRDLNPILNGDTGGFMLTFTVQ